MKNVLAIVGLIPPVSLPIIVIAGLILAALIFAAALFLFRSGSKKNAKAAAGSATNDWQPQVQPGAQGGWNPQQGNNPWSQAGQAPAGAWNAPPTGGQQPDQWSQQPAANQQTVAPAGAWGAPTGGQQPDQWSQQPAANQQTGAPAGTWGAPTGGQQGANSWGAQQSQAPANPWGQSSSLQANQWGQQGTQDSWGQQPAAAQQPWGGSQPAAANPPPPANQWGQQGTQDSWGQQPAAAQQPWGAQQQNQPTPTAFSGQNAALPRGQQQSADQWSAQTPGNAATSAPQWQAGFGQGGTGVKPEAATAFAGDGDKTMLRPAGSQTSTTTGMVRVEEGKEPGRTYEIRKEALSIGRSRESDIFLEDLAVSRLHASILNLGNGTYALRDEGSANGTKVNGQTATKYQNYPLQEGDKIQLGQTVLAFTRR